MDHQTSGVDEAEKPLTSPVSREKLGRMIGAIGGFSQFSGEAYDFSKQRVESKK
jgi:predicted alternative tryptophan synthase beta-subunit